MELLNRAFFSRLLHCRRTDVGEEFNTLGDLAYKGKFVFCEVDDAGILGGDAFLEETNLGDAVCGDGVDVETTLGDAASGGGV